MRPPPPEDLPAPGEPGGEGEQSPPRDEEEALRRYNTWEADAAWRAVAYLITGPLVYGGVGWALDRLFGTSVLVGVGIVTGMTLSLYLIWFRYGSR